MPDPSSSSSYCPAWDRWLIALHSIPDMVTAIAYLAVAIYLFMIYIRSDLKSLAIAFPLLWQIAIGFFFASGIALFGSAFEIWQRGALYYFSGVGKVVRSALLIWFIVALQRNRNDMITISRVVYRASQAVKEKELESDN